MLKLGCLHSGSHDAETRLNGRLGRPSRRVVPPTPAWQAGFRDRRECREWGGGEDKLAYMWKSWWWWGLQLGFVRSMHPISPIHLAWVPCLGEENVLCVAHLGHIWLGVLVRDCPSIVCIITEGPTMHTDGKAVTLSSARRRCPPRRRATGLNILNMGVKLKPGGTHGLCSKTFFAHADQLQ